MMFVGAFLVDIGIEHNNLHRRMALGALLGVGVTNPTAVVSVFASIAFLLSTCCSNVATTVMLVPFAIGLLDAAATDSPGKKSRQPADALADFRQKADLGRLSTCVLLAIAFGANCGGIATLIGTPPNAVLAGQTLVVGRVTFTSWLLFALPLAVTALVIVLITLHFAYLRGNAVTLSATDLQIQYAALGRTRRDEMCVGAVLLLQVALWIVRPYLLEPLLGPGVNDAATACAAALLLFAIPSTTRQGEALLTWSVAQQHLPWGVLLLIGGGFALAQGCEASGLTAVVGGAMASVVVTLDPIALVASITVVVCLVTQLTSNTATANTILPLLIAVSEATLTHPLLMLLPATAACSFAFMLPAATAPNAVVFATGRVSLIEFVKTGTVINVALVLIGSVVLYGSACFVFDVTAPFHEWACVLPNCEWLPIVGSVGATRVTAQACALPQGSGEVAWCRLRNGTTISLPWLN